MDHIYIKYFILVIFLPLLWVNELGMGDPIFYKYICPAETLEGRIPLVLLNEEYRFFI